MKVSLGRNRQPRKFAANGARTSSKYALTSFRSRSSLHEAKVRPDSAIVVAVRVVDSALEPPPTPSKQPYRYGSAWPRWPGSRSYRLPQEAMHVERKDDTAILIVTLLFGEPIRVEVEGLYRTLRQFRCQRQQRLEEL